MDKGERKCREMLVPLRRFLTKTLGAKKVTNIEDECHAGFYAASYEMSLGNARFVITAGWASGEMPAGERSIGVPDSTNSGYEFVSGVEKGLRPTLWRNFLNSVLVDNPGLSKDQRSKVGEYLRD